MGTDLRVGGVDYRVCLRKIISRLVVVGNDHAHTQFFGSLNLPKRTNAAVNRNQQLRTLSCQEFNRVQIEPISLFEAIGNVYPWFVTKLAEKFEQKGRRSYTISVIVAIDGDVFVSL